MRASLATATILASLAIIVVVAYSLQILDPAVGFLLISVLVFLLAGSLVAALLCHVPFRSAAPPSGAVSGGIHRGINVAHVPVLVFRVLSSWPGSSSSFGLVSLHSGPWS